jgi:ribosomal protein S18 acetylase RimI-like enzyme
MGQRGRFGKYGEIKRLNRLRRARKSPPSPRGQETRPSAHGPSFKATDAKKTSVKIRLAKPSDSIYIAQLSKRVFLIYGPYEKIISSWLESGMTVTLVALMNRRLAGFVMISHFLEQANPQYVSELLAIAVAPEKQRMGIGEMLLKEVEKKAAQMGILELFLHTAQENLAAQNLFAKNEYVLRGINEGFYPAGQNALIMSKKIWKIPSPK